MYDQVTDDSYPPTYTPLLRQMGARPVTAGRRDWDVPFTVLSYHVNSVVDVPRPTALAQSPLFKGNPFITQF